MAYYDEEKKRAQIVATILTRAGLKPNPIKAILANSHWESQINPAAWERPGDGRSGAGLFQWTPMSGVPGLIDHLGEDVDHDYQWQINYLLNNSDGRYYQAHYPVSWSEFQKSTKSPSELTYVFQGNFERPGVFRDRWGEPEPYGVYSGSTGEMIESFKLNFGNSNGSGIPIQVFRWIFNSPITINQGPFETGVDHNDCDATDFGPIPANTQQPVVAPYDGYLTDPAPGWASGNARLFHSKYQVKFADGTIGYATTYYVHDETPKPVGEYKRGDVIGYTGLAGFATGRHLHFEVIKTGKDHKHTYYPSASDDNQFGIVSGGIIGSSGGGNVMPEFGRNTKHGSVYRSYYPESFWVKGGSMSPTNAMSVTADQKASIRDIGWSVTQFANDFKVTGFTDTVDGNGGENPVDPNPPRDETDEIIGILNDIFHGAPNPHPELF